jgi:hypothetical protein
MAFAYVVPVPFRNVYYDVTFHDCLASEPGLQLVVGGLFHAVQFVVFHLRKIGVALLHHDVTSRAGAASAAGMFEVKPVVHRDIENRFRLAMPLVGQLARFKLECLSCWKEGYFRHLRQL